MKTAVSVPDPVFERAERQAARQGVTRSRLYALALEAYLDRVESEIDPVTATLNEVYGDSEQEPDTFGAEAARRAIDRGDWEW